MLREVNYEPFTFWEVFLAVVLISKILFVLDHLPWIHLFLKGPLIYNVAWKTTLYWISTLSVRLMVRFISFLVEQKTIHPSIHKFYEQINWGVFWGVGLLYLMLFGFFVIARELTIVIGLKKIKQLFLGQ